ncbi:MULTISPECIES: hypothetical protein [unclassified Streptomyces]|uniref:hypothetical protein n=1 Tax=unclassified Streptomyces TaxID=2593676 RepID=UPI000B15DBD9|nr:MULTISPECIES: hypothetical protein [unclassified Streptomyces]AZM59750.1 hypothetical protein DLM49_09430 [Streptomyces sp. WAC 01438]RSM93807.1 hypothetical protein DMA10_19940 [Streptomyces sp. WAC 01420]
MSFPSSPRARSGPHRRSLLAVAAPALLATGCSAGSAGSGTSDGGAGRPSAADRARARAARDSAALAARYDAVVAGHPKLAERLGPLRAEVLRHAEAFGGAGKGSPSPSSSPSPSPSGSGAAASGPAPHPVPAKAQDALAELAAAERELADRRTEALLDVPGELARLLASVAAAGAAHVYLLTEAGR